MQTLKSCSHKCLTVALLGLNRVAWPCNTNRSCNPRKEVFGVDPWAKPSQAVVTCLEIQTLTSMVANRETQGSAWMADIPPQSNSLINIFFLDANNSKSITAESTLLPAILRGK